MLLNLPPERNALAQHWGYNNNDEYVSALLRECSNVEEKEAEYRQHSLVIAQIGIGWGGILLGYLGLLAAVLGILISKW